MSLGKLQQEVLAAFFNLQEGFFLTGGAALSAFYLDHRPTHDLHLFTESDLLNDGDRTLRTVAAELGATVDEIQTAPDFRRRLLTRSNEGVLVDLVRDRVAQLEIRKRAFGSVLVDTPTEIQANKLCAILSRSEVRDLVDLAALERFGLPVDERAIAAASRKDAGLTAAQLAWALERFAIPETMPPLGGMTAGDLSRYRDELVTRLVRFARPD